MSHSPADLYDYFSTLSGAENALRLRVRQFMEEEVAPVVDQCWEAAEFPHALIPRFAALGLLEEIERGAVAPIMGHGLISMELARVDPGWASFYGVHAGLAMNAIRRAGSEAQKEWIGNATFADVVVIWARDEENQVRGFLVRTDNPGYRAEKIEGKIAQRTVQNGLITLEEAIIPETDRLPGVESFVGLANLLRMGRAAVAWQAVGCAMGAYEHAAAYARSRKQFGKSIGGFQLIQMKLVQMLGNITAMLGMALRVSRLQEADAARDEHSALAKQFCAARCRETVALARELMGGNGILVENGAARLFADAEAIYSYEGTNEMNALIVGRAITGISAFV